MNEKIPLMMCTTEAEKSRVIEAIKAGVNGYIVQPFTPDSLRAMIENTMAKAGGAATWFSRQEMHNKCSRRDDGLSHNANTSRHRLYNSRKPNTKLPRRYSKGWRMSWWRTRPDSASPARSVGQSMRGSARRRASRSDAR